MTERAHTASRVCIEAAANRGVSEWTTAGAETTEIEARLSYLKTRDDALEHRITTVLARAKHAEQEVAIAGQRLLLAQAELSESRQTANDLAQRLSQIESSSIWRISYPVRQLGARFPGAARVLRTCIKLVWWTTTLQLRRLYRLWRDYHAVPLNAPAADQPVSALPAQPDPDVPQAIDQQTSPPTALQPDDIRLPYSPDPIVTLLISTYGQLEVTLACLRSIADHPPSTPTEVIVVDDAYQGPEDMGVLQHIPGILLIRNASNLGFLRSCNRAARAAKGRYIHMLNNDTEIQAGTVDSLAELLEAHSDIGMAGSKLLFPDGRLQEAGGILWTDASGWNFGRGEDPDRPEFNYLREVDYCSGASIMVRRALFELLGGFDDNFAPAYYEDTDLAFRIRAQGWKVVYEPRSVVVHHEGVSHGTDLALGVKAHQLVNQKRMLARWGETLAKENYDGNQHVIRARDRAKSRKIVLVIDHRALEPDRDAGSRSTWGIIDSLIDAGWIVKFWPLNRVYSPIYTTAMERRGIEVLDHRWPGDLKTWMEENGLELDYVLIARPDTAAKTLPDVIGHTNAVLSYYGHDLHFARLRRQALLDGDLDRMREAAWLERLERRVWRSFDVVIYPSEEEASVVRDMSPHTLACAIVPFYFPISSKRTAPIAERNVLFVAGFAHPPNVDAAMFLVLEIIPRLEAQVGPVKVTLAGSAPTEAVRNLASNNITVTGYVTEEDLSALYNSHRVSVVPLRFGAGVKGKVVESLGRGLPLVTTTIGAQGILGLREIVPVCDDADSLAEHLALLLTNDSAWVRQSHAQTEFASNRFSRAEMQRSVLKAFEAGAAAVASTRRNTDVELSRDEDQVETPLNSPDRPHS